MHKPNSNRNRSNKKIQNKRADIDAKFRASWQEVKNYGLTIFDDALNSSILFSWSYIYRCVLIKLIQLSFLSVILSEIIRNEQNSDYYSLGNIITCYIFQEI